MSGESRGRNWGLGCCPCELSCSGVVVVYEPINLPCCTVLIAMKYMFLWLTVLANTAFQGELHAAAPFTIRGCIGSQAQCVDGISAHWASSPYLGPPCTLYNRVRLTGSVFRDQSDGDTIC